VKSHDMRDMTLDELQTRHDEMLDELVNLRIRLPLKQVDNPLRVRMLRRDIARARTILREKALGAKPGEKPVVGSR
jgi:large subunit ribosomal protein L29